MISAWFWRLTVGLSIVATSATSAATPSDGDTFGYRAPPECPNRAEFSAQVAARTTSWLSPSSPFAVTVTVDQDARGLVGRVTFTRAEQRTVRELGAAGCNELVQALAFIVAVLIDPHAGATPLPPASEGRPPPVYLLPAPAVRPFAAPLWFIAGPEAAVETNVTGDGAVSERLFLGIGRGDRSLWLSSARLVFGRAVSHASSPMSGASAEFVRETARVEGCVLRLTDDGLAFEPCPFVEFGRIRAVGIHRGGDVTHNELWGSLGLVLRPTWTFSRRLVLGAGLGAQLPFRSYHFAFTGEPEVARTPTVAFEASLCLGLHFP